MLLVETGFLRCVDDRVTNGLIGHSIGFRFGKFL